MRSAPAGRLGQPRGAGGALGGTSAAPPPGPPRARSRWARASRVQRNAAANFVGRAWPALLALLCLPLYVRVLGVEAYGLMGFYATLQGVLALLDMGLSTTLNRELARHSGSDGASSEPRDLVLTLQTIYFFTALIAGAAVFAAAPAIASEWVNARALAPESVVAAIRLMGGVIAFQLPFALYQGGLLGLQRHQQLNALLVGVGTLRALGGLAVVYWVSPMVEAFFAWQLAMSAVQTALSAWMLWRQLPAAAARARFRSDVLRRVRRFAAGMTAISLTVVVLVQLDKVLLSRLLTLERFGYYVLAGSVAAGLQSLISPLFSAVFPRLSQLVAAHDEPALRTTYHRSCQAMSVLILPIAVVLALFAPHVMLAWTGSPTIVSETHVLVSLLTVGTALNGLMNVPYALQLAHGWTRLPLYANVIAVAVLTPAIVLLTSAYGAVGAAAVWVMLNLGYVTLSLTVMHRRLLRGELAHWYAHDVGGALLASVAAAGAVRVLAAPPASRWAGAAVAAVAYGAALSAAIAATPAARRLVGAALARGAVRSPA